MWLYACYQKDKGTWINRQSLAQFFERNKARCYDSLTQLRRKSLPKKEGKKKKRIGEIQLTNIAK